MSILHEIVDATRKELSISSDVKARVKDAPPVRPFSLRASGISLIAEIKRASPAKGPFDPDLDAAETARVYEKGGASAISCLTNRHFQGSTADLEAVRAVAGIPVLRKEFIIDELQIHEARAIGADAILLLAQVLDKAQLRGFRELSEELGMAALVEAFSEEELDASLDSGAKIVGVNNRDLETFDVDLDRSLGLRARVPKEVVFVSESGISRREDVQRLEQAGVDAMLVGEEIVRAKDRGGKIAELLGRHT